MAGSQSGHCFLARRHAGAPAKVGSGRATPDKVWSGQPCAVDRYLNSQTSRNSIGFDGLQRICVDLPMPDVTLGIAEHICWMDS